MAGATDLQQIVTGLTRMARARPDLALRQARSLLEQFPRLVPVQCLAANLARQSGDLDGAERHLDAALAEDPEAPPALAEKGVLAATRDDYTEAARCFRRLIDGGHRRPDLLFNLALAEEHLGHYEQAAAAYRETLAVTAEEDPEVRARLGGVLAAVGDLEAARAELEAALAADQDCVEALLGMGMMELGAGRMEDAIRRFRECVERQPESAEAWQQILESRRIEDPSDPDIEAVRSLLARGDLPMASRERLGFALGKACDDLGLYDEAFEYFRQANALKHRRLPAFDREAWTSECARRIEDSRARKEERGRRRSVTTIPIFIVGLPRSGTTLVDQIFTSHPEVAGVGELPFFDSQTGGDEERLRTAYLERLGSTAARYVTNKFPANFRHLPLIRRLFP
jgi:tetratricopeptide (TPR) repeat protein